MLELDGVVDMQKINKLWLKNFKQMCKKYQIASDLIDFTSLDWSLNYYELFAEVEKAILNAGGRKPEEDRYDEEYIEYLKQIQYSEESERAKAELEISIKKIKTFSSNEMDKYFESLKEYEKTLIKAQTIFGLIVEGNAGWGKSFTTAKTLQEAGLELEKDFVFLQTYITPMEMYQFIWRNYNKIIVLDDIGNLFEDEIKVNILMSALWSPTEHRIITWGSSTSKLEAPTSFEFIGKMIILTNRMPEKLDTLKSRCFYYFLDFNYQDKIKLIYEVCKLYKIPLEIADFISRNTTPANSFNFRTVFKLNELRKVNINAWQSLGLIQLEEDENKQILWDILEDRFLSNTKDKIKDFTEKTGLSRSTFFRYKKELSLKVSTKSAFETETKGGGG